MIAGSVLDYTLLLNIPSSRGHFALGFGMTALRLLELQTLRITSSTFFAEKLYNTSFQWHLSIYTAHLGRVVADPDTHGQSMIELPWAPTCSFRDSTFI